MVFPFSHGFSYGFPMVLHGFSYGFPIFLWVFLWVFLWFSNSPLHSPATRCGILQGHASIKVRLMSNGWILGRRKLLCLEATTAAVGYHVYEKISMYIYIYRYTRHIYIYTCMHIYICIYMYMYMYKATVKMFIPISCRFARAFFSKV